MTDKKGYQCTKCGRTKISSNELAPECCNSPMQQVPLDSCVKPPADAESARTFDDDDACDDFRSG